MICLFTASIVFGLKVGDQEWLRAYQRWLEQSPDWQSETSVGKRRQSKKRQGKRQERAGNRSIAELETAPVEDAAPVEEASSIMEAGLMIMRQEEEAAPAEEASSIMEVGLTKQVANLERSGPTTSTEELTPQAKAVALALQRELRLSEQQLQQSKQAIDELTDAQLCVVCMANRIEVLLLPCRHVKLCITCADRLANANGAFMCPYCRDEVSNYMKVIW